MQLTKYTNGYLCDHGVVVKSDLYVDNETQTIVNAPALDDDVTRIINLQGNILAPGFLDIQNNGIYGLNFLRLTLEATPEETEQFEREYHAAMKKYLSTGVTALCPTVTLNFPKVYKKVLPFYHKDRVNDECDLLGAHLEGPFISKQKKGCHPVETFVDAKLLNMEEVYGGVENLKNVCIITAAPEIAGVLDTIPEITRHGIIYSVGHTMADHDTAVKAVENGATMVTHMYNAMPQPHHRQAGVVGLMTTPGIETPYYGLICDGVHIDPLMARLAYLANPEKVVLVTDAMHMIGLPDGTYLFDKQVIVKQGDRCFLQGTDTLAGALTTLPVCVRNLMHWTGISLAEAVKTCTNNAADSINVTHKGYLNVGCDADFVVMDHAGYVQRVFKLNHEVASSDKQPEAVRAHL